MSSEKILIVGAGLAGLTCAYWLDRKGLDFTIVESSESVGGRVKTDRHEGFMLDRGFQIFLTAYPEARKVLDYPALNFKSFFPGALVRSGDKFHRLADPIRQPMEIVPTLLSPVGNVSDKMLVASLRAGLLPLHQKGDTTLTALQQSGFSENMINEFFRPFFGGIFLEQNLETSSRMFEFLFKIFSDGDNVLPAAGMQSIPEQIASRLPGGSIQFNKKIERMNGNSVSFANGESKQFKAVVIACEEPEYKRLTGQAADLEFRSQTCVYYSSERPPFDEPLLVLNGEKSGIVNNFCVPSNVSSNYSPAGQSLMSASIVGTPEMSDEQIDEAVRSHLSSWYGRQVASWRHLRTYRIKYALPSQSPGAIAKVDRNYDTSPVFNCGDYKETGSINGAMASGRKVAEMIAKKYLQ